MLINNAGYDLYGAAEETTAEELRAQLETNLLRRGRGHESGRGRDARTLCGKIINVSSIGGLIALP